MNEAEYNSRKFRPTAFTPPSLKIDANSSLAVTKENVFPASIMRRLANGQVVVRTVFATIQPKAVGCVNGKIWTGH